MTTPRVLVSQPWSVVAVAVLVVNDHWLKAHHPGVLSGKLSDLAGMFFFPLLLGDVLLLVIGKPASILRAYACLATAVTFGLMKMWAPAHEAYCVGLGALQWPFRAALALVRGQHLPTPGRVRMVMDASDLLALPMVALAFVLGRQRPETGSLRAPVAQRASASASTGAASTSSVASSSSSSSTTGATMTGKRRLPTGPSST